MFSCLMKIDIDGTYLIIFVVCFGSYRFSTDNKGNPYYKIAANTEQDKGSKKLI